MTVKFNDSDRIIAAIALFGDPAKADNITPEDLAVWDENDRPATAGALVPVVVHVAADGTETIGRKLLSSAGRTNAQTWRDRLAVTGGKVFKIEKGKRVELPEPVVSVKTGADDVTFIAHDENGETFSVTRGMVSAARSGGKRGRPTEDDAVAAARANGFEAVGADPVTGPSKATLLDALRRAIEAHKSGAELPADILELV